MFVSIDNGGLRVVALAVHTRDNAEIQRIAHTPFRQSNEKEPQDL